MKKLAGYDASGNFVFTAQPASDDLCKDFVSQPGLTVIEIPFETSDAEIMANGYYKDGIKFRPIKPSAFHDWDLETEIWVPNLDRARQGFGIRLEEERQRRNQLPIVYDGKRLGAKELPDQKNLNDKKSGVQERLRLGIGMDPDDIVWKDEDNIIHRWTDLQTYYDWLSGFVIALEDRGTKLYRAMWQHKENLKALTTVEAILAYDIDVGWPS